MTSVLLVPYYIRWHYGRAMASIALISANIIWFLWHFFSIGSLFRTLFAPWRRLNEAYGGGFDIGAFGSTMIINGVVRMAGAIVRSVFILIGFFSIAIVFIVTALFEIMWVLLPLIICFSIYIGIHVLSTVSFSTLFS